MNGNIFSLWRRVIEPTEKVTDPGERRSARLLAAQFFVVLVLVALGAVTQTFLAPDFLIILPLLGAGWLFVFFGLQLARRGRHRIAAFLVAAVIIVACTAIVVLRPEDPVWEGFLNLAVLFAAMFVSTRALTLLAAMALGGTLVGILVTPELQGAGKAVPLLFYQLIAVILIVLTRAHNTSVEADRRAKELADQERLATAKRVELFGRLAGGVAHDFNNVLQLVSSCATLLEYSPAVQGDDREVVKELLAASERAGAMTKALMMFAKEQTQAGNLFDLNKWLKESLPSLESGTQGKVSLAFTSNDESLIICANQTQVRQVVENIVNNAAQASNTAARVALNLDLTHLDPNEASSLGCTPGSYARLVVSDNGVGMSSDTLERVFEPFFSTRSSTEGTGLGMASVWAIVQQQQGHISAESELNEGSLFRVLWPLAKAQAA